MKLLVLLAVLGSCAALPQGFLVDTPEVIAERQRFFQLYNEAAAAAAAAPDDDVTFQQASRAQVHSAPQTPVWTGPLASTIPAGVQGSLMQVSDTPEVVAARRAFENTFQKQLRATVPQKFSAHHAPRMNSISIPTHQRSQIPAVPTQPRWTGPVAATIPAGLPGSTSQVRNTPEVEAAINQFTKAYNDAVIATSPVVSHQAASSTPRRHQSFSFASQPQPQPHFSTFQPKPAPAPQPRWTGPVAATIPAGLPGSTVVGDTPEVAAAKASFGRVFQQQLTSVLG